MFSLLWWLNPCCCNIWYHLKIESWNYLVYKDQKHYASIVSAIQDMFKPKWRFGMFSLCHGRESLVEWINYGLSSVQSYLEYKSSVHLGQFSVHNMQSPLYGRLFWVHIGQSPVHREKSDKQQKVSSIAAVFSMQQEIVFCTQQTVFGTQQKVFGTQQTIWGTQQTVFVTQQSKALL